MRKRLYRLLCKNGFTVLKVHHWDTNSYAIVVLHYNKRPFPTTYAYLVGENQDLDEYTVANQAEDPHRDWFIVGVCKGKNMIRGKYTNLC